MEDLYATSVLGFSVYLILWLFVIYSFLGVVVEMVFSLAVDGVLESRLGLLYLPLRPMYGIGGVACMVLLHPFVQQPILVFGLGMVICTVVEYVGALAMERGFGAVFWDYSHKPLNLHGRICLHYSVAWGLLALLPVYAADPLAGLVNLVGRRAGETVLTVLMVLVLLCWALTLAAFARLRRRLAVSDSWTDGQPAAAAAHGWDRLVGKLAPDAVLVNTFPQTNLGKALSEATGTRPIEVRIPLGRASRA